MNYYDHITNMVTLTRVESQKSLSISDKLDIQKNMSRPKNLKLLAAKKLSSSEIVLGQQQRRKSTPNGFEKMSDAENNNRLDKKYGSQKNLNSHSEENVVVVERSPRKLWTMSPKRPVSLMETSEIKTTPTKKLSVPNRDGSNYTLDSSTKKLSVDIKLANQKKISLNPDGEKKKETSTPVEKKSKKQDKLEVPTASPKTPKTDEKLASLNRLSKALSDKLDAPSQRDENQKVDIPIIVTNADDEDVEGGGGDGDDGALSDDEENDDNDGNLKPQSSPRLSASPSSGAGSGGKPGGSSKARQKKFHRHFQQVAEEERVINYYSCALVSDILLQGHLYITNNYFAFYSNVFGFVTKLLIPTASVLKISKEKTARIIPNAVGVATLDEKHVFGSFMSRDSAHRLMLQVWRAARPASGGDDGSLIAERDIPGDLECSECSADEYSSGSGSGTESPPAPIAIPASGTISVTTPSTTSLTCRGRSMKGAAPAVPVAAQQQQQQANGGSGGTSTGIVGSGGQIDRDKGKGRLTLLKVLGSMPRQTLLLVLSTTLLVLLFLSAGFLLYRIGQLHDRSTYGRSLEASGNSNQLYHEVLHWQSRLRSQSANEVTNMLASHLDQIMRVRQSLESLSMLLASDEAAGAARSSKHAGES